VALITISGRCPPWRAIQSAPSPGWRRSISRSRQRSSGWGWGATALPGLSTDSAFQSCGRCISTATGRPYGGGLLLPDQAERHQLVPPTTRIEYRYLGPSQHLYSHLRIRPHGTPRRLPLVWAAGAEAPILAALLRSAIEGFQTAPVRSRSYVWATLWRVEALTEDGTGQWRSPHVCCRDRFPGGPAGQSRYRARGCTPGGDLAQPTHPALPGRARLHGRGISTHGQADLADHLLRDSTMPIATIATTVDIPDLQAFNKACRRFLGGSPRTVRSSRSLPDS
jgi:AraC family transcriptional regulator